MSGFLDLCKWSATNSNGKQSKENTLSDMDINIRSSKHFRWIFHDKRHKILVCMYPRGSGKTYASFNWIMSRVLTDNARIANGLIYTMNFDLLKSRITSILHDQYGALVKANLIRMDGRNGTVYIFADAHSKIPYRVIHTKSYQQAEGGTGEHDKYIVCDEAGYLPRLLWDKTITPIAIQNISDGGQFLMVGTPQGTGNVFYELYARGQADDNLVKSKKLTCYDIYDEETINFYKGTTSKFSFRQELMCDTAVSASYGNLYQEVISTLEDLGNISDDITYDPRFPVNMVFDLGYNDATAVWFWQTYEKEIHIIDYLEVRQLFFKDIIQAILQKPYWRNYEYCILPHDSISHHHSGGGVTVDKINQGVIDVDEQYKDTSYGQARAQGWKTYVLPRIAKLNTEALQPVIGFFPYCKFNKTRCAQGLDCLKRYSLKTIYNKVSNSSEELELNCLDVPEERGAHLHACDSFRYLVYSKDIWWTKKSRKQQEVTKLFNDFE